MDTTGLEERSSNMQFNLSAWEQWIVDKAKEERIRKQQKDMEVQGTAARVVIRIFYVNIIIFSSFFRYMDIYFYMHYHSSFFFFL